MEDPGNQVHPLVHQRAIPGSAVGLCVGRVFHDDPNLAVVVLCCPHGGGYQAQYHHQCQQQRNDAFLHMHFPPVKYLCPAVSGKSTKCVCGGGKADTHPVQKPPVHPLKKETPAAHGSCLRPTKKTPAALNVLRRAILLPRAVEPMAPRLHPTFSGGAPNGGLSSRRPCRFGASLRPQCRSRGASDPVPFRLPPDPHRGLCSGQPHSILGHDSLSGPVSPQSHSYHTRFPRKSQRSAPCKTALYCRTAKNRRSGAESPCFAGKKDV